MHSTSSKSSIEAEPLRELLSLWQNRESLVSGSPSKAIGLAEKLLARGEPFLAYDLLNALLLKMPASTRVRQLLGLSLARTHATATAQHILTTLYNEGNRDEETLGLLARTWKDRWTETSFSPEGKRALLRAFSLYEESFRARPGAYWTGINAATLALLLKKTRLSYRLAGEVAAICERKLKTTTGEESYWLLATLGEAALVRGELMSHAVGMKKRVMSPAIAGEISPRLDETPVSWPIVGTLIGRNSRSRLLFRRSWYFAGTWSIFPIVPSHASQFPLLPGSNVQSLQDCIR